MEIHPTLFTPVRLGAIELKHRVVMAPLTRSRSDQPGDFPGSLMLEDRTQRASDGGLIVSEATSISPSARGWYGAPGLFTDRQVEGWKSVVAAVHAMGGKMVSQLWHTGRSSHVSMIGGVPPGTASVNPAYWEDQTNVVSTPGGWLQPSPHRALTVDEIRAIVGDREAAARAKAAGFDGAEIHSGNGYLLVIEPWVKGNMVVAEGQAPVAAAQLRKIFKGPLVAAGGFEPDKAEAVVRAGDADAVAFGRHFIANPDLPVRIRRGYPLARHDRDTFYSFDARGYTDYPAYSATAN